MRLRRPVRAHSLRGSNASPDESARTTADLEIAVRRALAGRVCVRACGIGLLAASLTGVAQPARSGSFPAEIELSTLATGDGSAGFVLNGIDGGEISDFGDRSGIAVSAAGDVNGDGIGDLIVGAYRSDPGGREDAGECYVIFGTEQGFPAQFELSSLLPEHGGDGSRGFVLNGIEGDEGPGIGDFTGRAVDAVGDFNGDDIDDLVISAPFSFGGGRSYVVFGTSQGFPAELELASLLAVNGGDGSAGFVLNGFEGAVGKALSAAGDVNGDGIGDLIIGAYAASPGGRNKAGQTYVIFGTEQGQGAELELSSLLAASGGDGSVGFVLNGIESSDRSGSAVGAAGDVNGDGIDDVIIGAYYASPGGRQNAGESYVVFGSDQGFPAELELSSLLASNGGDGSAGFVLNGIYSDDAAGFAASGAGDLNGDGFGDLVIGAPDAIPVHFGEAYVMFGTDQGFEAEIELSSLRLADGGDGSRGFVLKSIDEYDRTGAAASAAGDVNGDGIDDLIVGASYGYDGYGESYVIFGSRQGYPAEFDLASLLAVNGGDGTDGTVLYGIGERDYSGHSVSAAGDVNGDGVDDVIIGAPTADPGGRSSAGESYVVFGRKHSALSASISGIDARVAACRNRTDPQTVFTPLPDVNLQDSWDCAALGLGIATGDDVVLLVRGVNFTPALAGNVAGVEDGATAVCRNVTQDAVRQTPLDPLGSWDCAAAGLPLANQDVVVTSVIGVAK